jgi:hypothetical protein
VLLKAVQDVPHVVRLLTWGRVSVTVDGCPRRRLAMLLSPRGDLLESGDDPELLARVAVDVAEAIAGCGGLNIAHRDTAQLLPTRRSRLFDRLLNRKGAPHAALAYSSSQQLY